jgi:hypothetical protein
MGCFEAALCHANPAIKSVRKEAQSDMLNVILHFLYETVATIMLSNGAYLL